MQTTSTFSKIFFSTIIWALIFKTAMAAPIAQVLAFDTAKNERVCIAQSSSHHLKDCHTFVHPKGLDSRTAQILKRSDQVLPLFSKIAREGHYFVLIARIPSKTPQSTGYCGAGYEDHLILLSYDGKRVVLPDDFLLQSCLKSMVLDNNKGDGILNAVSINMDTHEIEFQWLADADNRNHHIEILNDKFLLK